jgi:2-polyprenyl-3-methyl-5-hydroxy-6-metoxy-1,4-benzoquinol methylase
MNKFDELAKIWDSGAMRVQSALEFTDAIKLNIDKDMESFSVLDYGCGTGLVSFALSDKVKRVVGLDNSENMLKVYNEKASKIGLENIAGLKHDINKDKLDKDRYDLVVTNMTMHHIKDTDMFINKLSSSLKKNGFLAIADLETEDGTFHSADNNDGVEHFGFEKDSIVELYEKYGLKNIKVQTLHTINKDPKKYNVFMVIGQK